ncbi:JAB domain-containing protein [Sphingomonas sp.]|uniref:JAB domain-containing protein n=1 Tax=Sphingomonas sp. TaxID=28214 RepID=UPI002DD6837D|nr:JAB domain-containing protein [Sphingomonas sp.]
MGDGGGEPRIERLSCAHRLFGRLALADGEVAGIAYLARDRRVLGLRLVRGGRDWVDLAPRRLVIDALGFGASGIVVAHNHPSDDARPSAHDLAHARRLARALEPIGIRLLDHLVVTRAGITSLRAKGLL